MNSFIQSTIIPFSLSTIILSFLFILAYLIPYESGFTCSGKWVLIKIESLLTIWSNSPQNQLFSSILIDSSTQSYLVSSLHFLYKVFIRTRMHSSRMRTGRPLTICRSLLPEGCLLRGGMCLLGGCLLPGGCLLWGCLLLTGVCLLRGGGGIPACTEADPPLVNRMTDTSKNITLATTSLQLVITLQMCHDVYLKVVNFGACLLLFHMFSPSSKGSFSVIDSGGACRITLGTR